MTTAVVVVESSITCVDNCTCKFSFKREMVEEYLVGVCGLTGVLS